MVSIGFLSGLTQGLSSGLDKIREQQNANRHLALAEEEARIRQLTLEFNLEDLRQRRRSGAFEEQAALMETMTALQKKQEVMGLSPQEQTQAQAFQARLAELSELTVSQALGPQKQQQAMQRFEMPQQAAAPAKQPQQPQGGALQAQEAPAVGPGVLAGLAGFGGGGGAAGGAPVPAAAGTGGAPLQPTGTLARPEFVERFFQERPLPEGGTLERDPTTGRPLTAMFPTKEEAASYEATVLRPAESAVGVPFGVQVTSQESREEQKRLTAVQGAKDVQLEDQLLALDAGTLHNVFSGVESGPEFEGLFEIQVAEDGVHFLAAQSLVRDEKGAPVLDEQGQPKFQQQSLSERVLTEGFHLLPAFAASLNDAHEAFSGSPEKQRALARAVARDILPQMSLLMKSTTEEGVVVPASQIRPVSGVVHPRAGNEFVVNPYQFNAPAKTDALKTLTASMEQVLSPLPDEVVSGLRFRPSYPTTEQSISLYNEHAKDLLDDLEAAPVRGGHSVPGRIAQSRESELSSATRVLLQTIPEDLDKEESEEMANFLLSTETKDERRSFAAGLKRTFGGRAKELKDVMVFRLLTLGNPSAETFDANQRALIGEIILRMDPGVVKESGLDNIAALRK